MTKEKPLTHCKFCGTKLADRYKGRSKKYCNPECRNKFGKLSK